MPSFAPSPRVARFVASIDLVDGRATGSVEVLPGTASVLGLQYRGRIEAESGLLEVAGVTGLQSGRRTYRHLDGAISVLVRFRPDGAARLGVPVDELTDRSVGLAGIVPAGVLREGHERLMEATTDAGRVAAVEGLLAGLPEVDPDPLVAHALGLLGRPGVRARVGGLAAALGLSERQLERRFRRRVGVGPKRFADLLRFERLMAHPRPGRLADLAAELGYYDEAHLIRHVRRFAGATPGALLGRRAR